MIHTSIRPRLNEAGLDWVNFQVMRRTHSSILADLKVRPKVVADQLGHSVDVNQNVYTRSSFGVRKEAVNALALALNGAQTEHRKDDCL
jgi:integrase